jgi:hypothetical protein
MINIAIDYFHPVSKKPMPNGIPLDLHDQIESMDGKRLDYPRLINYMKQCRIGHRVYSTESAPVGSWYLMVFGFFDFEEDYFLKISPTARQRLKNKTIRLLFTYHEGDHPGNIRQRIDYLCSVHNIDPELVYFISGNSTAEQYHNCYYWPELEFMYWRTVNLKTNFGMFHSDPRPKNYIALCRIDKLWRKVFMSDLWENSLHHRGFFSYTQHLLGEEDDYYECALRNSYLQQCQPRVDKFIEAGPFRVDEFDSDAHNRYDVNMTALYADSYFNVVLETMIEVDNSGGQFITEKTFKPIFNNQFFVAVSSVDHQRHLRDLGYQTFGRLIDESYDTIASNQERFEAVLALTKQLAGMHWEDLHNLYHALGPEIVHNHQHFVKGMQGRLRRLIKKLTAHSNTV